MLVGGSGAECGRSKARRRGGCTSSESKGIHYGDIVGLQIREGNEMGWWRGKQGHITPGPVSHAERTCHDDRTLAGGEECGKVRVRLDSRMNLTNHSSDLYLPKGLSFGSSFGSKEYASLRRCSLKGCSAWRNHDFISLAPPGSLPNVLRLLCLR